MITQDRLRELLNYDPETGLFTWKAITSNRVRIGQVAGTALFNGYIQIKLDGAFYKAHRLAWLYVYGVWPADDLDHLNRDRKDNRIANLREATRSQNTANKGARVGSVTGLKGVRFHRTRAKYQSRITVNYKEIHLGYFDNAEAAHEAYRVASEKFFGEFARTA